MKISGFTIIRNAVINDYPVTEAIRSILPVVDEMLVSVGDSEDDTEGLIRAIASPKIRIVHSVWDPTLKKGGEVLAAETDKAFRQIAPDSDWAFYIQADEIVHEKFHSAIRTATARHLDDKAVEGLLFDYLHFYGTYDYIGDSRKWYHKEVRIVRNDPQIRAFRDAQGFRKQGKKIRVKPADAFVFHYGWVKSPRQMKEKLKKVHEFWRDSDSETTRARVEAGELFDFNDYDSLRRFEETHPAVMLPRIEKMNWKVDIDLSRKNFSAKDRLLYWWEKKTGQRLFDFKNYELI